MSRPHLQRANQVLSAAIASLCMVVSPARAAPAPSLQDILGAEAFAYYDQGQVSYDVQRYGDAIAAFQDGYRVSRHPIFVFAIARAERRAGRCREAIVALERFIGSEPGAEWTARAKREIAGCRLQLTETAQAVVRFDAARAAYAAAHERRERRQRWALAVGGAGLVALGAGAGAGYLSSRAIDQARHAPDDAAYRARVDEASGWRTGAAALLAAGAGAVASGVLLWITAPGEPARPLRDRFFVTGSAGGGRAALSIGGTL